MSKEAGGTSAQRDPRSWHATELLLSRVLRSGVLLAGAIVLLGGIMYLARHGAEPISYREFLGEPPSLSTLGGIGGAVGQFQAAAIIQLGLLVLIATPVMRVFLSVLAFARVKDWIYVAVTLVVLGILVFSFVGGVTG
jgi:uncharacterized membrane protein